MNATFGEMVLLTCVAGIVVIAALREVLLFARWISGMRKLRIDRD